MELELKLLLLLFCLLFREEEEEEEEEWACNAFCIEDPVPLVF